MKTSLLLVIAILFTQLGKTQSWLTTGNSGTDILTNFFGTTDNKPLIFKINNVERMRMLNTGKIGIGTKTPQSKLDVNGDINIAANSGFYIGSIRMLSAINSNTTLGLNSLINNTSGTANVAIGNEALKNANTTQGNIAIGDFSLFNQLTQPLNLYDNIAIGRYSLYNNNGNGYFNIGIGVSSLYKNVNGSQNVGIGINALINNSDGNFNVAVGTQSLYMNEVGSNNTFVGYQSSTNARNINNAIAIGSNVIVDASNKAIIGNSSFTSIGGYADWTNFSDGRYKTNIKENIPGLEFINKLKPITYSLNIEAIEKKLSNKNDNVELSISLKPSELEKSKIKYTGFIAQEVQKAAESINYDFSGVDKPKDTDNSFYGLRYAEFVVPLVKAVQELSKLNDAKDSAINNLQQQINELKAVIVSANTSLLNIRQSISISSATLGQNIPNPFSSNTIINYTLPQKYSFAKIMITDIKGNMLKQINVSSKDKGSVSINTSSLVAGSYSYSLWIDGKLIDTKQMISTK